MTLVIQQPDKDQPITSFRGDRYSFLSNFYHCDHLGTTTEHLYQAAKTTDPCEMIRILMARTPGDAKRLGARCRMRDDWERIKIGVMRQVLEYKFQDPQLAKKLLATRDAELVEGNTWGDKFWGVCGGVGLNTLGLLLMERRTELAGRI